jgi:hypothetical protein
MRKKSFSVFFAVLFALAFAACGSDDDSGVTETSRSASVTSGGGSVSSISSSGGNTSSSDVSTSDAGGDAGTPGEMMIDMAALQARFEGLNSSWPANVNEAFTKYERVFTALSAVEDAEHPIAADTGFNFSCTLESTATGNQTFALSAALFCGDLKWRAPEEGTNPAKITFWFKGGASSALQFDFAGAGGTANYLSMNGVQDAVAGTWEGRFATSTFTDSAFSTDGWVKVSVPLTEIVSAATLPNNGLGFRTRVTASMQNVSHNWSVDFFSYE